MPSQVSDPFMGFLHPFPTRSSHSAQVFASMHAGLPLPRRGQCSRTNISLLFSLVIALAWPFFLYYVTACSVHHFVLLLHFHPCRYIAALLLASLEGGLGAGA